MKIVNYEKMKRHFENVVDVKLFTVPNILTIMETFTEDLHDAVAREDITSGKFLSTEDLRSAQRGIRIQAGFHSGYQDPHHRKEDHESNNRRNG